MRLRARTLSGSPGGFLYAPRKMLRAEVRGHNSQLSLLKQVSPDLQRIFLRAKRKPGSLHKESVPEDSPALCVGGSKEILKSRSILKILWIVC